MKFIEKIAYIYLFFSLYICTGCKETSNKSILQKITLKSETLFSDKDLDISTPIHIQIIDSLLVTVNNDNDVLIDVWNMYSKKKLNSFIKKGNGPSEFRRIDSFRSDMNDSYLYFYNIDKKTLCKVHHSELLNESPQIQEVFRWNLGDNSPFVLTDTYKLKESFFAVNKTDTARFLMSDFHNNLIPFEKFPNKNNINPNLSDMGNAQLYTSKVAISPNGEHIMLCGLSSNMIDIIKFANGSPLVKTTISTYPNDIYLMPMDNNIVYGLHTSKTKYYYIDACATNDYVYAIWKGNVHDRKKHPGLMVSNIVKVYDWNGNECYELILDKDIFNLTVSPDNQIILALTDKEDGYAILKYEMDLH